MLVADDRVLSGVFVFLSIRYGIQVCPRKLMYAWVVTIRYRGRMSDRKLDDAGVVCPA